MKMFVQEQSLEACYHLGVTLSHNSVGVCKGEIYSQMACLCVNVARTSDVYYTLEVNVNTGIISDSGVCIYCIYNWGFSELQSVRLGPSISRNTSAIFKRD